MRFLHSSFHYYCCTSYSCYWYSFPRERDLHVHSRVHLLRSPAACTWTSLPPPSPHTPPPSFSSAHSTRCTRVSPVLHSSSSRSSHFSASHNFSSSPPPSLLLHFLLQFLLQFDTERPRQQPQRPSSFCLKNQQFAASSCWILNKSFLSLLLDFEELAFSLLLAFEELLQSGRNAAAVQVLEREREREVCNNNKEREREREREKVIAVVVDKRV